MIFGTYFWDQLPNYFEQNDTYQDQNGKGLLERFLGIFGVELDNNTVAALENFINEKNPLTADSQFLSTIAYDLGSPVDFLNDEDSYREYLTQLISIYQVKGTSKSYQLLFALLGFSVNITELPPTQGNYDTGGIYDDSIQLPLYDNDCPACSQYNLDFQTSPGLENVLTTDLANRILQGISFIQPINVNLYQMTFHQEGQPDIVYIDGILQAQVVISPPESTWNIMVNNNSSIEVDIGYYQGLGLSILSSGSDQLINGINPNPTIKIQTGQTNASNLALQYSKNNGPNYAFKVDGNGYVVFQPGNSNDISGSGVGSSLNNNDVITLIDPIEFHK